MVFRSGSLAENQRPLLHHACGWLYKFYWMAVYIT
jgi:hypothetical protein